MCESLADIISSETSPRNVLRRLNRRLFEATDDFLLTLVIAAIDPDRHVADIANGANYSFVVRSHGSCDRLGNHDSMPLGILDDIDFAQQTLTLDPGDQLLFLGWINRFRLRFLYRFCLVRFPAVGFWFQVILFCLTT